MAPILFIAAAIMAFATGTSWGTFAILIPIAVPIAQQSGLPIEFLVAAVLGGGIFGDHASPSIPVGNSQPTTRLRAFR